MLQGTSMMPTLHRSQRAWLKGRGRRDLVHWETALAWWEFGQSSDVPPPSSWHMRVSTSLSASPAVALGRLRLPGGRGSVDCGDGDAGPVWKPRKCECVCASARNCPFYSPPLTPSPKHLHSPGSITRQDQPLRSLGVADPGWVLQPEPSHPSTPWEHPQDPVAHVRFAGAADSKLRRASLGHFSDVL